MYGKYVIYECELNMVANRRPVSASATDLGSEEAAARANHLREQVVRVRAEFARRGCVLPHHTALHLPVQNLQPPVLFTLNLSISKFD